MSESNIESLAREAYNVDQSLKIADGSLDPNDSPDWGQLPEWKREAWRCEVDINRDPDLILRAQRAEDNA